MSRLYRLRRLISSTLENALIHRNVVSQYWQYWEPSLEGSCSPSTSTDSRSVTTLWGASSRALSQSGVVPSYSHQGAATGRAVLQWQQASQQTPGGPDGRLRHIISINPSTTWFGERIRNRFCRRIQLVKRRFEEMWCLPGEESFQGNWSQVLLSPKVWRKAPSSGCQRELHAGTYPAHQNGLSGIPAPGRAVRRDRLRGDGRRTVIRACPLTLRRKPAKSYKSLPLCQQVDITVLLKLLDHVWVTAVGGVPSLARYTLKHGAPPLLHLFPLQH
ncbi:hypothetical protein SKAU_G00045630 [Synaphobranchus kaupii]|uniref:Uncharacterized protein n=1 Tax=Synaphobranchus kaupii TaxID=118154 RepID=A0A9Q1J8X2_SYNKA|nr:hypothetical protein SKAU_G00045630 [Synaphobranchus kaupii]